MDLNQHYTKNELFRYVSLSQPAIIDIDRRCEAFDDLKDILGLDLKAAQQWAKTFLAEYPPLTEQFAEYLEPLNKAVLSDDRLPKKSDLKKGSGRIIKHYCDHAEKLEHDKYILLSYLLAHSTLNNHSEKQEASRWLQYLESLPELSKHKHAQPLAYPLSRRLGLPQSPLKSKRAAPPVIEESATEDDIRPDYTITIQDLKTLWKSNHRANKKKLALIQEELEALRLEGQQFRAELKRDPENEEAQQQLTSFMRESRERKRALINRRKIAQAEQGDQNINDLLNDKSTSMEESVSSVRGESRAALEKRLKEALALLDIKGGSLCDVFSELHVQQQKSSLDTQRPSLSLGKCFIENPRLRFKNHVRPLAKGMLIKVEETFLKYSEGEIQYIENILAGEKRLREHTNTLYNERLEETETFEETETSEENSVKIGTDLRSTIENEISTRFTSDVNASASGSGGGTIGVVDFEGTASLQAGLGIGVDTRMASSNESEFSRELLNKALETTKTSVRKRQLTRSYSLYETNNLHKIDNTLGDEIKHRRGIYCFLNKHVCITETEYGVRMFLLGNVLLPGKNLICEQQLRRQMNLKDVDARPVFEITPDDIHPESYKDWVGKYNAANVNPPPDAIVHASRTYKTDQTNTEAESESGIDLKKIAETLVPFFEEYQRHLITDTLKLPEGYEVLEVKVAVNHGANGISIPAHLPITLAGATVYSMPTLAYAAVFPPLYLPIAIWQIAQFASPLMHFNVDSSNATVCIGTEAKDSKYFFFEPDELINELFGLLSNFSSITPNLINQIQTEANSLFSTLQTNANNVPAATQDLVRDSINNLVSQLTELLNSILQAVNFNSGEVVPTFDPDGGELTSIVNKINALATDFVSNATNLNSVMGEFFTPVNTFFNNIFTILESSLDFALPDLLTDLLTSFENSQTLTFGDAFGTRRELPLSLNVVSIKPGITVNLVACLGRTEEALEKWRLETFTSLHQAYMQQLAEYESRNYGLSSDDGLSKSPGTLRAEEKRALKEILLHTLNNHHDEEQGPEYDLDRINLFEHGIDWENMSYRLYQYGPNASEIKLEQEGLFKGVDAKRRSFMMAHWAQVLLPLPANQHIEDQMMQFFKENITDLEGELTNEELAVLYQDLILQRKATLENPNQWHREEILPTDFVALKLDDKLPENEEFFCGET